MKKILVSGGPVHAKLDSVKIITNRFRGGLMAKLAEDLNSLTGVEVHYLSSKASVVPEGFYHYQLHEHLGFWDYMEKVTKMAPGFDAVVLGAAVCNLIPVEQIKGKFPSHNYKPGDVIPINFTIAPRVIDEVKKVAPNTHLFGYKLLAGVPHEELIQAAYDIVLESKATCVFANDANDLNTKFAVTKEGAEHEMGHDDVSKFILDMISDKYYKTSITEWEDKSYLNEENLGKVRKLIEQFKGKFKEAYGGYVFGTVALRVPFWRPRQLVFITTARGKKELEDFVLVATIDNKKRAVDTYNKKATLNAPLLARIFRANPKVQAIVHYHELDTGLPVLPYAPPGTLRDSMRPVEDLKGNFEIENHGVFRLLETV